MSQRPATRHDTLSIGRLADRTGFAISAIRFYEEKGLIASDRNAGGQRRFARCTIRRLSFVRIAQSLGFSLVDIRNQLDGLPFAADIDARIAGLENLKTRLAECIGCGCLSLERCRLYNPDDRAATLGDGPRYLLGDSAADIGVG